MQTLINFVVALPSEAKPIIRHFGLQHCDDARGVKLFRADNLRLIVSGVGKAASAAAVGYAAGSETSATPHIWLNVGIAGHAYLAKGTAAIAHLITDAATGASYYPSIVFRPPCDTYALSCHDQPTTTYAGDAMCDMESAAFFAAASRFSNIEFVHALKIISDNSATDIDALDRAAISQLIEDRLELIESVAEALQVLHAKHVPDIERPPVDELLARWHFTVTQATQLRELARRWALLQPEQEWPSDSLERCQSSRDVLARLAQILDSAPLQLGALATR